MNVHKYLQPYKEVWLAISEDDEGNRAKELLLSAMKGYLHRVLYVSELGIQAAIDEVDNLEDDINSVIESWEKGEDLVQVKDEIKKSPYSTYNEQFQI